MKLGVVDRDLGLHRDAGQDFQVPGVLKFGCLILRIQLDGAEGSPLGSRAGGPHMTERSRKAAMLRLNCRRSSWVASADRIACSSESITVLMIVRLTRIGSPSSTSPRTFFQRGVNSPFGPSSTMNPRSALWKIVNRLSNTWGRTSSKAKVFPRLCVISIRASKSGCRLNTVSRPLSTGAADFDLGGRDRRLHRSRVVLDQQPSPARNHRRSSGWRRGSLSPTSFRWWGPRPTRPT